MIRVEHFVKEPEIRQYTSQGIEYELEIVPNVFPPSPFGLHLADNITVNPNETVSDVGTGSGNLAILAAKLGGIVTARDISLEAVELTKRNAKRNNVNIEVVQGGYIGEGIYDVIIENLPTGIVHKSYMNVVGEELEKTLNGGSNGNELVRELLKIAPQNMHEHTRFYLPVSTLSMFSETIKEISEKYNARVISTTEVPTKEYVEDNIEFYKKLQEQGIINIFLKKNKWHSRLLVFELKLE